MAPIITIKCLWSFWGPYWRLLELEPLGIKMAPGVRAGKEDGSAEIFFNR
jgi:hypothetical protein